MNLRWTFLCAALLIFAEGAFAQDPATLVGKPMPKFSMTDLSGKRLTNASLKGKVIVMDFWATWCITCRHVSPIVEDLHQKFQSKGLVAIGVDVAEKKPHVAARYKKLHHYSYRFTEDNDKFATSIGVGPLPTVIVVDRKGIVRRVEGGYYSNESVDMDKLVAKLIAEK